MKILLQAFLGAAIVHVLYFVTACVVGYVKTLTYRPNIAMYWDNADKLSQEVSFGTTTSPFFYLATFLGIMLTWGIVLFFFQKMSANLPL